MNPKPAIIALLLATLSVLAVIFIGPAEGPGARRAAMDATLLVSPDRFPIEDIDRITLTRRGEPTMTFQRDAIGWKQLEPFPVHMDRYRMRQIVNAARAVEVLDRISLDDESANGLTLDDVSLNPPLATIEFAWPDSRATSASAMRETMTLELGRTGIGGRAYLRRAGENEVLLVTRHLHEHATLGDPRGWRDRTLFREVGVDSDRIVRLAGGERLVLERDRRQWLMIEPVRTRVDERVRDVFMEALGAARVASFIADQPRDLARFGLQPPVASLTVMTTRRQPNPDDPAGAPIESVDEQRLLIGSPAGAGTQDRFAMMEGQPTVMRLPVEAMQRLFMQPGEMVAATASGVFAADVKTIVVRTSEGDFRLQRDLERWIAPNDDGREVPADRANALLAQLTEARAESVSIHEYPHDLEVATITFHSFDDRPIDTVRIIRDPETARWGLENGDNVFRIFPAETDLPLTPEAFGLSSAE